MMPIRLGERLIASHPSNRVFHHNPSPGERPIVGDILRRTVFASRLATGRSTQASRMQLANPDLCQITNRAQALWQSLQQLRLLQYGVSAVGPSTLSDTSTISPLSSSTATWLLRVCCFFLPL
jgi:hypothetical protein